MDKNLIDGHKLHLHPDRVARWLAGENIYPINVEISPINKCNLRCIFCAFDYTGYKGGALEGGVLKSLLHDMASHGVKSLVFAGTGEPLMHKDLSEMIRLAKTLGLDVGLSTNGVFLTEEIAREILPNLTWIRISLNAGSKKDYARVHGCKGELFDIVLENIAIAAELKKKEGLPVSIGVQSLVLEENKGSLLDLAREVKKLEVDYFTLKPFSKHPLSKGDNFNSVLPSDEESWFNGFEALAGDGFQVIARRNAMQSLKKEKAYKRCLGLPFLVYVEADGNVYACNTFVGMADKVYGNINQSTFTEIWEAKRRQKVMRRLETMGANECRMACRLDQMNRYLWELKCSPAHVNFV